jgi:hypothetical protein
VSYRCGVGAGMHKLGFEPCEPAIVCDGCGLVHNIVGRGFSNAPAWFLDGKAPRGWRQQKDGDARKDYCPRCK